jgi:hypothetical protein
VRAKQRFGAGKNSGQNSVWCGHRAVRAKNCPVPMLVVIKCLTTKGHYEGRGNKALLQLGVDACKTTEQAQNATGDERNRLLDLTLQMRLRELQGWMQLRAQNQPDGVGESIAAMGIANVFLLKQKLDLSLKWYARAEELCPADDSFGTTSWRNNIEINKKQVQKYFEVHLLDKKVRVHGLKNHAHYNSREGRVLDVHASRRYEVLLDAVESKIAVHIIVHDDNLMLV